MERARSPEVVHAARDAQVPRASLDERAPSVFIVVAFGCVFTWSAIAPTYRQDWLLENVLVFAAIVVVLATWHQRPLSRASYTQIFLFLALHEIGAHYTYSLVPYDA